MKKRAAMLALALALILLCGNAMAEISGGGLLATADANGVITLTGDVALSSTVTFAEGKTYTIKGNGHKLTHGDSYRGALLTVPKNTTLTIENLVIDGGNTWTLDNTKWAAAKTKSDNNTGVTHQEVKDMVTSSGVDTNGALITVLGGSVTMTNTTVQNMYTTGSGKVFWIREGGSVSVGSGTTIKHCAAVDYSTRGLLANIANGSMTMASNVVVEDMFGSCNGAMFDLEGNATLTLNGANFKNVKTVNANGQLAMIRSNSTMTMNSGTIENFVGLRGTNNPKQGIIYMHSKGKFIMNGGIIRNNIIGPNGVVDATYVKTDYVELNGGSIVNNKTDRQNTTNYSIANQSPVKLGKDIVIDAPINVTPFWDAHVTDEGNHSQYLGGAACKIGDKYYGRIDDASHKAKDGETITLVRDTDLNGHVVGVADKDITIDLNGKKLSQSRTDKTLFNVDKGTLRVTDSRGGGAINTSDGQDMGELSHGSKIIFVQPSGADVPKTGDSTPLALLFTLLALSGLAILTLRKKSLTH